MKITFLGTNGWYDTNTGNTICTLIETKSCYIILDAGNGIYKADRYIKKAKPVYLFLSHFHLDHIIGLHILLKFKFSSLNIFGQPGTSKIVPEFIGDIFSVPPNKLPYKCKIADVGEGWHNEPFKFRCLQLKHVSPCFGYRLEIDNKVISYCTDTGPCKEAVELSKDADLLISECAFKAGHENPGWPHMNPELAGKLAIESGAKKLALTHFDANEYQTLRERKEAERSARRIFKNTVAALDDMEQEI
jgi:ribonuclease BN (tRNA processing enzyme)